MYISKTSFVKALAATQIFIKPPCFGVSYWDVINFPRTQKYEMIGIRLLTQIFEHTEQLNVETIWWFGIDGFINEISFELALEISPPKIQEKFLWNFHLLSLDKNYLLENFPYKG